MDEGTVFVLVEAFCEASELLVVVDDLDDLPDD